MPPTARDIKRVLARIRAVLPVEKQFDAARRNIRLGLERISRIIPARQDWIGIHVAGTNGKGSICMLLAGMLRRAGLSHGVFVSPAMPEPHNGVLINGRYANKRMYELETNDVCASYRRAASGWKFSLGEDPGDLTPFELQTATAFRVFDKMHVKYGIVEVGMGGATDATNAMREKAVTIISRIGLDHQEYLGGTIEAIAKVKAGIMRKSVPCIVDDTNPDSVLAVLTEHANEVGTQIWLSSKAAPLLKNLDRERFQLRPYEERNLMCALLAFQGLFPNLKLDVNHLVPSQPFLPGRKERVSVTGLTGGLRKNPLFVDGAHNLLGVEALAAHVNEGGMRKGEEPLTWVMGMSSSTTKPFAQIIETLLRPQDNLAFAEYEPQANDPLPAPADLGRDIGRALLNDASQIYDGDASISAAVQWACAKAGEGPVVVTGSLYMIRELYKVDGVEPQCKIGTMRPGPSQLWHYTRQAMQRVLTDEEEREFKRARQHNWVSPRVSPVFRDVRDGGKPRTEVVPEWVRDLHRTAAHHKKQADGYGAAIASIEKDMGEGGKDSPLGQTIRELKVKQGEHRRMYDKAILDVRQRVSNKRFLSYTQIFGRRKKRREGPVTALLRKYKLLDRVKTLEAMPKKKVKRKTEKMGAAKAPNMNDGVSAEEQLRQRRDLMQWRPTETKAEKVKSPKTGVLLKMSLEKKLSERRMPKPRIAVEMKPEAKARAEDERKGAASVDALFAEKLSARREEKPTRATEAGNAHASFETVSVETSSDRMQPEQTRAEDAEMRMTAASFEEKMRERRMPEQRRAREAEAEAEAEARKTTVSSEERPSKRKTLEQRREAKAEAEPKPKPKPNPEAQKTLSPFDEEVNRRVAVEQRKAAKAEAKAEARKLAAPEKKTSTARKIGQVYYNLGILAGTTVVEISASDLTAQSVSQTGPKVRKMMDKALGQVLFIDEAYGLRGGGFAQGAVDELVGGMTKPRYQGKMIIILTGYVGNINKSRFPQTIRREWVALGKRALEMQSRGKTVDIS
ncbi:hypothetical protein L249_1150 [Ophiocordyceps polyrhachis-furcata BCC 54312]|uniref:Mur ligase central domain-containing protein n=1 Tax=Ophiocordyceps polyrhachis-furcata BCC 54312 TaxID=1330021 RepID=A0A367LFG2_9HYPO|nr:hypothetical protein L249_1150 [Ophiocordyceps polyrhachis-furcata BCC 54312]